MESLPDEWEAHQPPDYTVTLGGIMKGLADVAGRLGRIEQHPALRMTPEHQQAAIVTAGDNLMSKAVQNLDHATEAFKQEQQKLAGAIGSVRGQQKQME